jgi:hypothetical protein
MAGIKTRDLIQKIIKAKRAGDVSPVVQYWPTKCKVLS